MAFDFDFDATTARHSATGKLVRGGTGTLHTYADYQAETWTSPLDFIPVGGSQRSDFTSDSYGMFPQFAAEYERVVFRSTSGAHVQVLYSMGYLRETVNTGALAYPIRPSASGVWTTPPSLPDPPYPFTFYHFDSRDDDQVNAPITDFPTLQDWHSWRPATGVDPNA